MFCDMFDYFPQLNPTLRHWSPHIQLFTFGTKTGNKNTFFKKLNCSQ